MYRGWTQTDYQNKHYNINRKDEGTLGDRGIDGGTNFIFRIKIQETRLTLQEHDDDDVDNDDEILSCFAFLVFSNLVCTFRYWSFKTELIQTKARFTPHIHSDIIHCPIDSNYSRTSTLYSDMPFE